MSGARWTVVAVAIPLLGLLAMVGRAEYVVATSPTWRFEIDGYDPRDLLHGHYLQVRYRLNASGPHDCGFARSGPDLDLDPACCLCLTRSDPDGIDPPVRQTTCDTAPTCDGWIRADRMLPPVRYFVPEDRALELETALRQRQGALELQIDRDGRPAIRQLYLDGEPWRDQVASP